MRRHRATTRVSLAALAFTAVFALSQQGILQAGPEPEAVVPTSILPTNVGVGVATDDGITITFDTPMDRASVEAGLQLYPADEVQLSWDAEGRALTIGADGRWRTDQRYLVVVAADARRGDGTTLEAAHRYSFTTQTAPRITDFQVAFSDGTSDETEALLEDPEAGVSQGVVGFEAAKSSPPALPPTKTAGGVSARTSITVGFSAAMDAADVEEAFAITPEVPGAFSWEHQELTFTPSAALEPGKRYTVSLAGAHDEIGNPLAGDANFSFITQTASQVVTVTPGADAADVTDGAVEIWFSRPMDTEVTTAAFSLVASGGEEAVAGTVEWNMAGTQLRFTPEAALAPGTAYEIRLAGALDRDGHAVEHASSFTTLAAPAPQPDPVEQSVRNAPAPPAAPPPPVIAPPPPSGDFNAYALAQINSARAAYGFAPLVLDAGASAAAYAHAYDQAVNNYFSHYSLDGRSREDRLRAAGVSFSYSGENQCYHAGIGIPATLDWCHSAFMAEPYPGHWNHIANILDPRFTRVGVGIAEVNGRVVITWNFVN